MNSNNLRKYRNSKLLLEIVVVIACKLVFIFGLWYFFFSPEFRPTVTPATISDSFLGHETPADHSHK